MNFEISPTHLSAYMNLWCNSPTFHVKLTTILNHIYHGETDTYVYYSMSYVMSYGLQ